MNEVKAQEIINQIVSNFRKTAYKGGRSQYKASVKYIAQAEELGILHLIPNAPCSKYIGNTEIQMILEAATDSGTVVMGAEDGETVGAHALYLAINETPEPEPTPEVTTANQIELTVGTNEITINDHEVEIHLQRDRSMDSVTAYITCVDDGYLPWNVEITDVVVDEDDDDADIVVVIPVSIVEESAQEWLDAEDEFMKQQEEDNAEMQLSRELSAFAEWVMENHPDARTEDLPFLLNECCAPAAFGGWREVKGRAELATVERRAATNEILTAIEADEMFGKARNTTSTNCRRGCFPSARQSGATWLIHVDDLGSFYGTTERLLELGYDDDPDENLDNGESTLAKIRNQQLRDDH